MRDYRLIVPRDCVGAQTPAQHRDALKSMARLFGARTGVSRTLRLR
jgi:hypothetical protein